MTPPEGSVLSEYYRNQQQGKRIPGYQGNVNDMRTTAPDGRSAYYDDYGNMYYTDTGAPVETREIPEDLSQPMVGPNSAYGPSYELGPNGPYDTRNINDPRHPDNPYNQQAPTQPDGGISIQGGFDEYGNLYGSQPYHYGQGPTPAETPRPLPQVDMTPYPQVEPEMSIPNPQPDPYLGPRERPIPQVEPTQSAGYLRSTGEGGYGAQAYYDEINAYLANHSQDEIQQAMGTYGVSQQDVDAARAYQQPQYARGGLSRMLKKVIRKVR